MELMLPVCLSYQQARGGIVLMHSGWSSESFPSHENQVSCFICSKAFFFFFLPKIFLLALGKLPNYSTISTIC